MAILYNSNYNNTLAFSDTDYQLTLIANALQTITLPGDFKNQYTVLFGYNATSNIFVGKNNNAAVPASNTQTNLQYVELRPEKRYALGGDVLSFITPDTTAYISVSVRSLP